MESGISPRIIPRRTHATSGGRARIPVLLSTTFQGVHMSFLKEFREFAVKGNAVDLAVGVIIGGAFGKIVDSLVGDVIMPVVGMFVGNLDFSNLFIVLGHVPEGVTRTLPALKAAGIPVLAYGSFLTILLNFIILAFVIFVMVRQLNRLRHAREKAPAPTPPEDVLLLREIRDELRAKGSSAKA